MSAPQTIGEQSGSGTFRVTARLLRRFLPGETRLATFSLTPLTLCCVKRQPQPKLAAWLFPARAGNSQMPEIVGRLERELPTASEN